MHPLIPLSDTLLNPTLSSLTGVRIWHHPLGALHRRQPLQGHPEGLPGSPRHGGE